MDLSEDEVLLAELFNAQYISKDNVEDTDNQICFWTELPKRFGEYFFPQKRNDGSFVGSVTTDIFFKILACRVQSQACEKFIEFRKTPIYQNFLCDNLWIAPD